MYVVDNTSSTCHMTSLNEHTIFVVVGHCGKHESFRRAYKIVQGNAVEHGKGLSPSRLLHLHYNAYLEWLIGSESWLHTCMHYIQHRAHVIVQVQMFLSEGKEGT